LYRQVMSATPTSANTGLTTWFNQGTAVVTDSSVGLSIDAPPSGSAGNLTGRFMTAPTPPYTIKALIAATRNSNNFSCVGIGWYDGTAKFHLINYATFNGGSPYLEVFKWTGATSFVGSDFVSASNS